VVFSGSFGFLQQKTDRHDIAEILLKVALITIKQTNKQTNKQTKEKKTQNNSLEMKIKQ
jgi:hypothetical protein